MRVAPNADPSDGYFDVVAMGDLSLTESAGLSARIYRGAHLDSPKVRHTRGTTIEATPTRSDVQVFVDLDGETPGTLPLSVRMVPAALRIRA
jgi:diacylglycerol kinase family enzyme